MRAKLTTKLKQKQTEVKNGAEVSNILECTIYTYGGLSTKFDKNSKPLRLFEYSVYMREHYTESYILKLYGLGLTEDRCTNAYRWNLLDPMKYHRDAISLLCETEVASLD